MKTEGSARGEVVVQARGPVPRADQAYAHDKVAQLRRLVSGPVLFARVDLVVHQDPARERPALVKAELDVNGHLVRAHAAASTVRAAVDLLEARLRERLERLGHLQEAKHLRHRDGAGAWRHGDAPDPRPSFFPRPVEEREVVRRKTFAVGELTPEEASVELEVLDHDFYLFKNALTGEDNVLHRVGEQRYELLEPRLPQPGREADGLIRPSPLRTSEMTADAAIDLLDLGDEPFVFFLDTTTRRGEVVYRRYDGHYGLITATDALA